MGKGFCFIGNQYRVDVGGEEFFIDLLFFNRHLQCLVAIELKRGKFKPGVATYGRTRAFVINSAPLRPAAPATAKHLSVSPTRAAPKA